ncbi:MAG: hypothetical protein IJ722_03870 [Alloprevotella sp.]|nr:hypothetical protein [Alloprevotella sp.]
MNRISLQRIFLPLLLATAFFSACSGDEPLVNSTSWTEAPSDSVARTLFSAGPEVGAPGAPARRSMINSDGSFYWTMDDNIFIFSEDGTKRYVPFATNISHRKQARTDFYVSELLEDSRYKVYYTGSGSADHDKVSIQSIQYQEWPNDSEHFAYDGDCGLAIAEKTTLGSQNWDYHYPFDLEHKAAYLLLLPRTKTPLAWDAPVKLEYIVVEDIDGNTLAGDNFSFTDAGLDVSSGENHSNIIELYCGDGEGNKFSLREQVDTAMNGSYIVLAPGSHRLSITYYLSAGAFSLQHVTGAGTALSHYTFDDPVTEVVKTFDEPYDYAPNKLRRISHELDVPTTEFVFEMRSAYAMWDAQVPLWLPQKSNGWDWTNLYLSDSSFEFENMHPSKTRSGTYTFEHPEFPHRVGDYYYINRGRAAYKNALHNEGYDPAEYTAADMPSANRVAYYLKYGEPRRDDTTYWWLKDYNDGHTLCQGGVWVKKWETFADQITETDPDAQLPGGISMNGTTDLSAKYPWGNTGTSTGFCLTVPYANASAAVKQRPSLDGLDEDEYFFLPALGEYFDQPITPTQSNRWRQYDKKTLRYVGVNGYYWTSTPLPIDGAGSTKRTNSAYYLQIYANTIGLNWTGDGRSEGLRRDGKVSGTRPDGTSWFQ